MVDGLGTMIGAPRRAALSLCRTLGYVPDREHTGRFTSRRTVRVAVGHDRLHRPHHVQKVRRDAGLLGTLRCNPRQRRLSNHTGKARLSSPPPPPPPPPRHLLPRLWAVGTVRHPRLAHPARHLRGHPRLHRHAHRWPVRRSDSQALVRARTHAPVLRKGDSLRHLITIPPSACGHHWSPPLPQRCPMPLRLGTQQS